MATYSYVEGGAVIGDCLSKANLSVIKKTLKVADIIAANATLTTNGEIGAGDVIRAIQLPPKFIVMGSILDIRVAGTAANTVDIGVAGGDELQDGAAISSVTVLSTLLGDDWGTATLWPKVLTTADTIDVTFVAAETVGEFDLYVFGIDLNSVAAVQNPAALTTI
jgi:hypothetical protein